MNSTSGYQFSSTDMVAASAYRLQQIGDTPVVLSPKNSNKGSSRIIYPKDFLIFCFRNSVCQKKPQNLPDNLEITLNAPRIRGINPYTSCKYRPASYPSNTFRPNGRFNMSEFQDLSSTTQQSMHNGWNPEFRRPPRQHNQCRQFEGYGNVREDGQDKFNRDDGYERFVRRDGPNRFPRTDGEDRFARSNGQDRFPHTDGQARFVPADREDRFMQADGRERFARTDAQDRFIRTDVKDRFAYSEGQERFASPDGPDRFARNDGLDRFARTNGPDRSPLTDRQDRFARTDSQDRFTRTDGQTIFARNNRQDRITRTDHQDRFCGPEEVDRFVAVEGTERLVESDILERLVRGASHRYVPPHRFSPRHEQINPENIMPYSPNHPQNDHEFGRLYNRGHEIGTDLHLTGIQNNQNCPKFSKSFPISARNNAEQGSQDEIVKNLGDKLRSLLLIGTNTIDSDSSSSGSGRSSTLNNNSEEQNNTEDSHEAFQKLVDELILKGNKKLAKPEGLSTCFGFLGSV